MEFLRTIKTTNMILFIYRLSNLFLILLIIGWVVRVITWNFGNYGDHLFYTIIASIVSFCAAPAPSRRCY
jgi:TM2 domain-containing membrane protein YozV